MSIFESYAEYYNIFNVSKAYEEEVDFVVSQFESKYQSKPNLLDLGCGTGVHALAFAKRNWQVLGVDISPKMLEIANRRRAKISGTLSQHLKFEEGDVRTFRCEEKFDVVTSLFHVASYQTITGDLDRLIETAKLHLKPNGILIFDYWYGPAVLNLKPSVRVRRYEDNDVKALRIGEPSLNTAGNVVSVDFDVTLIDKSSGRAKNFNESHLMRYFFLPEIESALRNAGFRTWNSAEWLTGDDPSEESWSVFSVAQL